jgi:hypothetical protein
MQLHEIMIPGNPLILFKGKDGEFAVHQSNIIETGKLKRKKQGMDSYVKVKAEGKEYTLYHYEPQETEEEEIWADKLRDLKERTNHWMSILNGNID